MTETLPDEAGTMPGLGPVPLLQRQSASNSRWTRTVPMASAALFVFGAILAHLVLQQAKYAYGYARETRRRESEKRRSHTRPFTPLSPHGSTDTGSGAKVNRATFMYHLTVTRDTELRMLL